MLNGVLDVKHTTHVLGFVIPGESGLAHTGSVVNNKGVLFL